MKKQIILGVFTTFLYFSFKTASDAQVPDPYKGKNTYELAKLLGKEKEVAELPTLIEKMTRATHKNL